MNTPLRTKAENAEFSAAKALIQEQFGALVPILSAVSKKLQCSLLDAARFVIDNPSRIRVQTDPAYANPRTTVTIK